MRFGVVHARRLKRSGGFVLCPTQWLILERFKDVRARLLPRHLGCIVGVRLRARAKREASRARWKRRRRRRLGRVQLQTPRRRLGVRESFGRSQWARARGTNEREKHIDARATHAMAKPRAVV